MKQDVASNRRPDHRCAESASEPLSFKALLGICALCVGTAIMLFDIALNTARGAEFAFYKTFQTPEDFLAEVFSGNVPPPETLVLDAAKQGRIRTVFGRPFPQARLRYWRDGGRTVWIFDDIGKEGYVPTTSGFVVRDGVIEHARVLIYRESRGEQVGETYFLQQLVGARADGTGLDRPVDNITGATYSVRMMQRKARTALMLDSLVE